jgi:hypothetical protein
MKFAILLVASLSFFNLSFAAEYDDSMGMLTYRRLTIEEYASAYLLKDYQLPTNLELIELNLDHITNAEKVASSSFDDVVFVSYRKKIQTESQFYVDEKNSSLNRAKMKDFAFFTSAEKLREAMGDKIKDVKNRKFPGTHLTNGLKVIGVNKDQTMLILRSDSNKFYATLNSPTLKMKVNHRQVNQVKSPSNLVDGIIVNSNGKIDSNIITFGHMLRDNTFQLTLEDFLRDERPFVDSSFDVFGNFYLMENIFGDQHRYINPITLETIGIKLKKKVFEFELLPYGTGVKPSDVYQVGTQVLLDENYMSKVDFLEEDVYIIEEIGDGIAKITSAIDKTTRHVPMDNLYYVLPNNMKSKLGANVVAFNFSTGLALQKVIDQKNGEQIQFRATKLPMYLRRTTDLTSWSCSRAVLKLLKI